MTDVNLKFYESLQGVSLEPDTLYYEKGINNGEEVYTEYLTDSNGVLMEAIKEYDVNHRGYNPLPKNRINPRYTTDDFSLFLDPSTNYELPIASNPTYNAVSEVGPSYYSGGTLDPDIEALFDKMGLTAAERIGRVSFNTLRQSQTGTPVDSAIGLIGTTRYVGGYGNVPANRHSTYARWVKPSADLYLRDPLNTWIDGVRIDSMIDNRLSSYVPVGEWVHVCTIISNRLGYSYLNYIYISDNSNVLTAHPYMCDGAVYIPPSIHHDPLF